MILIWLEHLLLKSYLTAKFDKIREIYKSYYFSPNPSQIQTSTGLELNKLSMKLLSPTLTTPPNRADFAITVLLWIILFSFHGVAVWFPFITRSHQAWMVFCAAGDIACEEQQRRCGGSDEGTQAAERATRGGLSPGCGGGRCQCPVGTIHHKEGG